MTYKNFPIFRRYGFSIPELLIAVSIIVIVSTVALVGFRGFDRSTKVKTSRDQIIKDTADLLVQSRSGKPTPLCISVDTNGEKYPTKTCVDTQVGATTAPNACAITQTCENFVPQGGYGVAIGMNQNAGYDITKYTFFVDLDADGDGTALSPDGQMSADEVVYLGEKTLPTNFRFVTPATYTTQGNFDTSNNLPLQIVFAADGTIRVYDSAGANSNVRIQKVSVIDTPNQITKTLFINVFTGIIYSADLQPAGSATGSSTATPTGS